MTTAVVSTIVHAGSSPHSPLAADPWPIDRTHRPPSVAPPIHWTSGRAK